MRIAFTQALSDFSKDHPDLHLLTADLGFMVLDKYRDNYPEKFLNVGVAESNMVGMAAGMATCGITTVCYSITPFLIMRTFEQIRNDVCYPNLDVKLIGVGSGFAYDYNGVSHNAVEDLSLMRSLPNMTILCPADPYQTYLATIEMLKTKGPVYLRLGKNNEPNVTYNLPQNFEIGKVFKVINGERIVIVTTGIMLATALEVVETLSKQGLNPSLVHLPTLKPLDKKALQEIFSTHQKIVTIEEHSIIGGLGSAISEVNVSSPTPLPQLILGTADSYFSVGGNRNYLRKESGLDAQSIVKKVKAFWIS